MPGPNLENSIRNFNKLYFTNVTPQSLICETNRFTELDKDMSVEAWDSRPIAFKGYVRGLSKAFLDYMKKRTQMNDKGIYDLSDVSLKDFMMQYEELVAENNSQLPQPRNRQPFEGFQMDEVALVVKAVAKKKYRKPLSSILTNSVINGEFTVAQMSRMVTESSQNLLSIRAAHQSELIMNDDGTWTEGILNNLGNIMLAREAMQSIRQQRGFFWKLIHFIQNKAEKDLMKQVDQIYEDYRNKQYPVDLALKNVDVSPMRVVLQNYNNPQQQATNVAKKSSVAQKSAALMAGEEYKTWTVEARGGLSPDMLFQARLKEEIKDALPLKDVDEGVWDMVFTEAIVGRLLPTMQRANATFDKQVSAGYDPQEAMVHLIRTVANEALKCPPILGFTDPVEQLFVGQLLLDVVLNKFSPIAFDEEKYEEYSDGYMLKNSDAFESVFLKNNIIYKQDALEALQGFLQWQNYCEKMDMEDPLQPQNDSVSKPIEYTSGTKNIISEI